MNIRAAVSGDRVRIESLMAPEIAAGTLLPRVVDTSDFLVAELRGEIVGVVGLKPWAAGVVELGSLVSARRGLGLGSALVEAAMIEAGARGYHTVVALTGIDEFFARQGFRALGAAPWAIARGCASMPHSPAVDAAIHHKARICAACPRLAACSQSLLARSAVVEVRIAA